MPEHPHLGHYLLYGTTFLIFGFQITGIGPIIPYLADAYGYKQTEYSFLFTCRSLGMLLGVILVKVMQNRQEPVKHHTFLMVSCLLIFVFMTLFSWSSSPLTQGLFYFIGAVSYGFVEVVPNVCLIMINPTETMEYWLLLVHGMFGVGALLGPFFVYFFELNAFIVSSLFFLALIPFYCCMETPENMHLASSKQEQGEKRLAKVSVRLEYILGLALFLYMGLESSVGGWISTLSILSGVSEKQEATMYVTIFWVAMTALRFGMAYLPGTSSRKMKVCLELIVATALGMLLLIWLGMVKLACYVGCILFGITMAPLYPFVFSVVSEFGHKLEESQTATIILFAQLAEGTLTALTGKLMEWFSYKVMFWWLILMAAAMWITRSVIVGHLQSPPQQSNSNNPLEVELNPVHNSNNK